MNFLAIDQNAAMHAFDKSDYEKFLAELEGLDLETVEVEGKKLKPSQCYHVGVDPTHVLFNTNCPETVKEKVNGILSKYRFK